MFTAGDANDHETDQGEHTLNCAQNIRCLLRARGAVRECKSLRLNLIHDLRYLGLICDLQNHRMIGFRRLDAAEARVKSTRT